MTTVGAVAVRTASVPLANTSMRPDSKVWPAASIRPETTYTARSEYSRGSCAVVPGANVQCR